MGKKKGQKKKGAGEEKSATVVQEDKGGKQGKNAKSGKNQKGEEKTAKNTSTAAAGGKGEGTTEATSSKKKTKNKKEKDSNETTSTLSVTSLTSTLQNSEEPQKSVTVSPEVTEANLEDSSVNADEDDGFFVMQSKKGRKKMQERDSKKPQPVNTQKSKVPIQEEAVPSRVERTLTASQVRKSDGYLLKSDTSIQSSTVKESTDAVSVQEDTQFEDFSDLEFTTQQNRKKRRGKGAAQAAEKPATSEFKPKKPQQTLETQQFARPSTSADNTKPVSKPVSKPKDGSVFGITQSLSTLDIKSQSKSQQGGRKRQVNQSENYQVAVQAGSTGRVPITEGSTCENYELTIPNRKTNSGTKGRPITIETNHLALSFKNLSRAVHYDVTITPSTPKKLFRQIMEKFRQQYYIDRYPAFDGTKNLYSSIELPFDKQIANDVTIIEGERSKSYKVIVKFANYVDMTPLQRFMTASVSGGIHHMNTPQEVMQCLDIVLRSAPALTCLPVGRSYFTPPQGQILRLGNGMEMYYGFYQSAVIGWKPFLNIDVAHKAFPARQNVIDLICELCNLSRDKLNKPLEKQDEETVSRFLRTLKIRYEIPSKPGTKREYRVNGLERSAQEATFKTEKKVEMTVEKYFSKEKGIVIRYPKMPCLWVGNKDRVPHILLPAEFCQVVSGQVINRKLPEQLTSSMIKQAATSTKVRKEKIMDSVRRAQFNQDPCVREFGITVDDKFAKINARVLNPPVLAYNGKNTVTPNQGAWRPLPFYQAVTLSQWTILCLDRYIKSDKLEDFVKLMITQSVAVGMKVSQPQRPFLTINPKYRKELQELEEAFIAKKNLHLVIVVVPNSGPFYGYVKQAAELSVGCLTQCIKAKTIMNINASTVGNILQKVNTKLEGINHILKEKLDWMKHPFMIMGADVTHPSPDSKDKTSIAAVTASYDPAAFKYNICYRLQPPKVEIIEDLENITQEQLLYFYKSSKGYKPERIVFFRDGVSEGQFSYVLNTEIQAIRRACMRLQPDGTYKPKITFLVVQKRHHTRFFPINEQDASKDKNLNVPVGTCVDTEITHPTALDFCLVSHASIQGVARPTKYRVLWDDADTSEDELEQLSFYFCHMFSRCTRSVSYPAPTYYAHLAAARITAYTENGKLNINNLPQEQERLAIKECIIKERPMFFV